MHSAISSHVRSALPAMLSLGLVLGVGLMSWASYNIWAQSVRPTPRIAIESRTPGLAVPGSATVLPSEVASRIRIVGKNDRTVVVPTDHAVLTVSTCYPFDYVGDAPKRYVLSADLVAPPVP